MDEFRKALKAFDESERKAIQRTQKKYQVSRAEAKQIVRGDVVVDSPLLKLFQGGK